MEKHIHIYMEASPNPNSQKFVVNEMLMPAGKSLDLPDLEAAKVSPLATKLYQIVGVERVFFMSNFVTITKADSLEWPELQQQVKEVIRQHLLADLDVFGRSNNEDDNQPEEEVHHPAEAEGTELDQRIRSVLDEYVKPAVEMDGGHIMYKNFTDGTVTVELQGSCSGCPSATVTLKSGIENLLKRMVPEVQTVIAEEA